MHTNIIVVTPKFLYDHILTRYGCPLTIIINQGTHFINDVILYLINHFILNHTNSIVYYPQGNGQVESISKKIGTLLTKLVNENHNDWMKTYPQFNFLIELLLRLKPIIPHSKLFMVTPITTYRVLVTIQTRI